MNVDLFAFTQGEKRNISFMSQALGLMADLDIGTEHLRWMGDSRFLYGFLRGSKLLYLLFPLTRVNRRHSRYIQTLSCTTLI